MINNNYIVFTCFYPHQTPKKMMLTNPESGHLSYCSIDHCGTAGDCAKCSWIVPKTSAGLDSPSYSRWMYTKAWLTSWQIRPLWREWFDKTVVGCLCREFHPVFGDLTSLDLWPCDPKSGNLCIPPGGMAAIFLLQKTYVLCGPTSRNPSIAVSFPNSKRWVLKNFNLWQSKLAGKSAIIFDEVFSASLVESSIIYCTLLAFPHRKTIFILLLTILVLFL